MCCRHSVNHHHYVLKLNQIHLFMSLCVCMCVLWVMKKTKTRNTLVLVFDIYYRYGDSGYTTQNICPFRITLLLLLLLLLFCCPSSPVTSLHHTHPITYTFLLTSSKWMMIACCRNTPKLQSLHHWHDDRWNDSGDLFRAAIQWRYIPNANWINQTNAKQPKITTRKCERASSWLRDFRFLLTTRLLLVQLM